ncbi:DMT family transporter [Clostridiaceae bacterium HSG29]|nr:DMT family transporter [Clostridiaceae bacterium HSG29]
MNNKTKGILYISLSSLFFSIMAITVKLTPNIPVVEKIFFRNSIGLIPILITTYRSNLSLKPNNTRLIFIRSILGVLGIFCYYSALAKLNLADAVILNKLSPFFVLILSFAFLKEQITKKQVISLILALLGAILIIRPAFNLSIIPTLFGLFSAIFAGSAYTIVRKLSETDKPLVIVFYFALVTTIITVTYMIITGDYVYPTLYEFIFLIILAISALIAQLFMTAAYSYAPAGELAIYTYLNIIFSITFGIIIWSEIPDIITISGASLIIIGGYINYISKKNA